ncbi:lipid II flippase MurJ [Butyricimonas hominis]|uniref:lipid II flippase MurJ n=1 Tax=Butyricimonas TaxID=574697 RepID=UPI0035110EA9
MLRQAIVVTFFLLLSSILGFVAQISYASYFGAGIDMDIYFLLLAIPSVIIGIAPVIFTSVFLPYFSSVRGADELMLNIRDIGRFVLFFSVVFSVLGCSSSLISIQSIIPNLPMELNSYAKTICCLLWGGAFCSLNSSYMAAILNFQRRFYLVAFTAVLPQSFMILSVVLFHQIAGVKSIAIGYMLALFFQWLLFASQTKWISLSTWVINREVKKYKPLLIRAFLVLVSLLPFTIIGPLCYSFAADLAAGSIAYLGYSASFAGFFSIATSMGIAVVSFPDVSSELISENIEAKRDILKKIEGSLKMVLYISVVIAVFLIVLRVPLLTLLLQRGEFGKESVEFMSRVFPFFIVMAVCVSGLNLLRNVLYAKKEYGKTAIIGGGIVVLFISLALLLREYFSLVGLGIAYAVSFVIFFIAVIYFLSDIKFHFLGKRFYFDLMKYILVSCISIGFIYSVLCCFFTGTGSKSQLFALLSFAGIGYVTIVYFLSRYIFELDEGKLIENSCRSLWRRKSK